jgi:NAD(P)-dependent dehydrogenase (short-subunit alcohol dehydrogenase family)
VIVTPDLNDAAEHPGEVMMRGTPAGGSGTPDAIAHAAVYLASDEAGFVHGTVIERRWRTRGRCGRRARVRRPGVDASVVAQWHEARQQPWG